MRNKIYYHPLPTHSLISSGDHCQRFSQTPIFDTPRKGFEPAQNLNSGFAELISAVEMTTTPRRNFESSIEKSVLESHFTKFARLKLQCT